MPESFYNTGIYRVDHSTFGGVICSSDFNTDYRGKDNTNGSSIAHRIANDSKFDEQCKKNRENKERNRQYGK